MSTMMETEELKGPAALLATEPERVSLREALSLAYDGEFDGQLSRRKQRHARALQRRHRRAQRRNREDEFFDELLVAMEGDDQCCRLLPLAATEDDFDHDTPLGLSSAGLFELIDGLLERVPAIIEAIKMFMALFAMLLAMVFVSTTAHADIPPALAQAEADVEKLAKHADIATARLAERYLAMSPYKFLVSFPRGDAIVATERAQAAWSIVWACRAAEIQETGLLEPGRLRKEWKDREQRNAEGRARRTVRKMQAAKLFGDFELNGINEDTVLKFFKMQNAEREGR